MRISWTWCFLFLIDLDGIHRDQGSRRRGTATGVEDGQRGRGRTSQDGTASRAAQDEVDGQRRAKAPASLTGIVIVWVSWPAAKFRTG